MYCICWYKQIILQMLTKQSLKDDIRDACQIQLKNLQMSLLKLHKQFLSAPPEESLEVMALSLEGVSGMIDTAAKEEEDFSTAKIGKMLMPTCEMCLRLCSQVGQSVACCKTVMSPVLMHWRYCSLAPSQRKLHRVEESILYKKVGHQWLNARLPPVY